MTQNQEIYISFIDLKKTVDKVWSSAILYVLWKRGIRGKLYQTMHKLNISQETRVMTKSGLRDTIVIEDNIRQRRPLSGPEFGLLIDELNLELRTTDLGIQYGFIILIGLLFMDDIASLERSDKELQEALKVKVNVKKDVTNIDTIS